MNEQDVARLRGLDANHLMHPNRHVVDNERHASLIIERGEGCRVWDVHGKEYIDGIATLWLTNIGHGRRELAAVAAEQINTLEFFQTFWDYGNVPSLELAGRLAQMTPGDLRYVSFTLGGSEANETALKFARFYFESVGQPERRVVVSRSSSYHGTSYGALTATGIDALHSGFGQLLPDFVHIEPPYCYRCPLGREYPACHLACADRLEETIQSVGPDRVAAFIAEPIMGVGGIIDPPDGYFQRIREICDRYGVLLITDEVITGFGRTGKLFGIEHWGVAPDIMSVAKGITSGYFPLGATIVSQRIYEGLRSNPRPLLHGFTYSGHPVGCVVAMKNLDILAAENMVSGAADKGAYLRSALDGRLGGLPWVGNIRGRGLMLGVELVADRDGRVAFPADVAFGDRVQTRARQAGLIVRDLHDTIVLAPPLCADFAVLDEIATRLEAAITSAAAGLSSGGRTASL